MPNYSEDRQTLNDVIDNPNHPAVPAVMRAFGLNSEDLGFLKDAKEYEAANPDDERVGKIRNKIFDKVARVRPAENIQGGGYLNRLVAKNLIDQDPNIQANYYSKKGFDTRFTEGNLEVKKPNDVNFKPVDPKGVDIFDAFDLIGDTIEGAAVALAEAGGMAFGSTGGPVGAVSTGLAAGGITSAAFEAARQGVAVGLGARKSLDAGPIAQAGVIGATAPGVLKGAGEMFIGAGKGINKFINRFQGGLKESAPQIKAAAKEIGAEATPGQLFDSRIVQELESAQQQSGGLIGGVGVRQTLESNKKAVQDTADAIVSEASSLSKYDVGDKVGKQLSEDLAKKLEPAEAIYTKYESQFKRAAYKPNLKPIQNKINKLKKELKFDPTGLSKVNQFEEQLKQVKNLDDLKKFRTALGNDLARDPLNKTNNKILSQLYEPITEARSKTLIDLAEKSGGKKKGIEVIERYDLPENVKVGDQHIPAMDIEKEVDVNYRLDGIEDIFYAVKDNKVVGHIGLDEDGAVKTVFVDPKYRRQGVAENLYEDVASKRGGLVSDDLNAMEPEAKKLWLKLKKKYPKQVTGGKNGDPFSMGEITPNKPKGDPNLALQAKAEIENADKIYRQSIEEVATVIKRPGAKIKSSPKKALSNFLDNTPEIARIDKILATNDPKKIAAVKKAFPETFEQLRTSRIQSVMEKNSNGGVVQPLKMAKAINAMPVETVNLVFGPNASKKAKALQIYLQNIPTPVGKSGTPRGMAVFRIQFLMDNLQSLRRDFTLGVRTKATMDKGIFKFIGDSLKSKKATALTVGTLRSRQERSDPTLLPPQANKPKLIP